MNKVFEKSYSDEVSNKDGGFIFQAILNYDLSWSILDGETSIDQTRIQGWLTQVDVFPDMKFDEGHATLTYVILSEVNLLKRKFELASEAIKRLLNPNYAAEMDGIQVASQEQTDSQELPKQAEGELNKVDEVLFTTKLTSAQIKSINDKYFKNTQYTVRFTINGIVLREVSTSGLDTGSPNVTLKLSTGMVDTLDGKAINSWDGFNVKVTGKESITITNSTDPKISEILVYDPIENINELIFRTIVPSAVLEFRGNRVQIDTYSNRSSQVSIRSNIDFDNLFNIEEAPKSEIFDTEEGEEVEHNEGDEISPSTTNK
jgi:hypothetical protein